ncbi:unnamed protein product [Lactuca saligna]|uniref:Uncharacterized protein n=1 Tax=Lactuca saligna TaxID=75948 RepID=A0AA36EPX0_LACSI|nr:unnamed protein product [Lactuca saligna]
MKVREDVNLKLQELRDYMSEEIVIAQQDYASLNQKVDIIAEVVTKFVKLYDTLGPKGWCLNRIWSPLHCLKPLGITFTGKNKKGTSMKSLFQVNEIERFTFSHYTNLLIRMNNCAKNSDKEKAETKKIINLYYEIRRVLHEATQLFTT